MAMAFCSEMAELLFIAPVTKKDITKPSWRGIPRVSFTRPAVADAVDPIEEKCCAKPARQTRASVTVGSIVIILNGEHTGRRGVVVGENGAGIATVAGIDFPAFEIDQDFLIVTSTKVDVAAGANEAAIAAAAAKVPELADYLKASFVLKAGDRPHLMKF